MRDQEQGSEDVGTAREEESSEPPGCAAQSPARADSEVQKLYLFHLFLSISLTVVASFLFIDRLFLRLGFSMSQFGIVKGLSFLVPVTLNLLLAPYLARLGRDREIVVLAYLIRVSLPFLFFLLPWLQGDTGLVTAGCAAIFTTIMIFPMVAQNSLSALFKVLVPRKDLGRILANVLSLGFVPAFFLAIPCSWYIDRHSSGSDAEFYGAFLHVMFATSVFVLPAGWFMFKVSPPARAVRKGRNLGYRVIREPFQNRAYRVYLHASFMLSLVSTMIISFINPYLLRAQGLSMLQISLIASGVSLLGVGLRPLWGRLCDEYGGKNVLRVSVVGVTLGLFILTGKGLIPVVIFAVLAWNTNEGLFGVGLFTGQQYLSLALSDEEKTNVYIAAASFVNGTGMFCGSLLGGFILDWLAGRMHPDLPYGHYEIYFAYCALAYLVVGHFVTALRERRRRVSSSELALGIYRALRSRMRR